MEQFVAAKNHGLTKMGKKKYRKALTDFDIVISGLTPSNDEETILKGTCLLNSSLCSLALEEFDQSLTFADAVVTLYQSQRSEDRQSKMDMDAITQDPLTQILCLAYCRRGQAIELKGDSLEALHQYSLATTLMPECEAQQLMKDLLTRLGFPTFNQADPDLQPFGVILMHLLSDINLTIALTNLLTFLVEGTLTQEFLQKVSSSGCGRLVFGIIQLYMDNEMIVVSCLSIARVLVEKGIQDVFNGSLIVRVVMEHWKKNVNVIGDCIRLMVLHPPDLVELMIRGDFIPAVCDALTLALTDEEIDDCFYLLYHLMTNEKIAIQITAEGVLDIIRDKRKESGFRVLSKLSTLQDVVENCIDQDEHLWAFEMLKSENEELIVAATHLLARMLQTRPIHCVEIFDNIYPVAMSHKKNKEIVANSFAALALTLPQTAEQVKREKLIVAASVLLSLDMDDIMCTANFLLFLYLCAESGLVEDFKEAPAVIPSTLKALKRYSDTEIIVENAVGIACLLDHSNKAELLRAATIQFPESKTLQKYLVPILHLDTLQKQ